mmetsp:Transcript_25234/g.85086  ORF Transcript_25234/g.85086 Transcript_25234/m.85086 type:complete len:272 (-) Transcript_25234:164-979(-)
MRGTGLRAHVEPSGRTAEPLTKLPRMGRRVPLFQRMACAPLTKSSGVRWKHSSVSAASAGQRRYWYPPPWLNRIPHATAASEPADQRGSGPRVGGSTTEPRSPILEKLVAKKTLSPPIGVCSYLPPACPHGSTTGAVPGARHGLKRYESLTAPELHRVGDVSGASTGRGGGVPLRPRSQPRSSSSTRAAARACLARRSTLSGSQPCLREASRLGSVALGSGRGCAGGGGRLRSTRNRWSSLATTRGTAGRGRPQPAHPSHTACYWRMCRRS